MPVATPVMMPPSAAAVAPATPSAAAVAPAPPRELVQVVVLPLPISPAKTVAGPAARARPILCHPSHLHLSITITSRAAQQQPQSAVAMAAAAVTQLRAHLRPSQTSTAHATPAIIRTTLTPTHLDPGTTTSRPSLLNVCMPCQSTPSSTPTTSSRSSRHCHTTTRQLLPTSSSTLDSSSSSRAGCLPSPFCPLPYPPQAPGLPQWPGRWQLTSA